jgi:hypothetical protein
MTPQLTFYELTPNATAFSTTRNGGYSTGAYASLNLNAYCGDDPKTIKANRELLCEHLNINSADQLIIPHQVHGTNILQVNPSFYVLPQSERQEQLEGFDAVITNMKGICIGVSTADCIPILIYDPEHHCAAAVHAGWRGTIQRITEKVITTMQQCYGSDASKLKAVIGPGISLKNFEIGDEVYDAFLKAEFPMETIAQKYPCKLSVDSQRNWKWHIDLPMCNQLQLEHAGMPVGQIHQSNICTYDQADQYFSARRLGINSGRIYTGIVLHET